MRTFMEALIGAAIAFGIPLVVWVLVSGW